MTDETESDPSDATASDSNPVRSVPARGPRSGQRRRKPKYRKAIGNRLSKVFAVVLALVALISVNSVYLIGVRIVEYVRGETIQNWFYLNMFLVHLVLGILLVVPVIGFGLAHLRNTYNRPNRRAVYVGYGLFATAIVLLVSGIVLTRIEGVIVVNDPTVRQVAYWTHVLTPLVVAWLYVLHRLAGRPIRWKIGLRWAGVAAVFAAVMLVWQAQDPRRWDVAGPASGERYFFPSLARTATGDFIPAEVLDNTEYCLRCHQDSHDTWANSVHRFASFNNPAYLASVRETRQVSFERDGDVQAARFCAGCHDPVVFFSGKFDDPEFDDVHDPTSQAGITCTACHAITHINSPRGNSDYTIEEPIHYPFAASDNPTLTWVSDQLVKAKPEFHKRTFLKDLHTSTEFCGTCHKVHLPEELNDYKWLRGQNHYDAFLLSGVSGHGVSSFYYPEVAQPNCNDCHMPLLESDQFAARDFDGDGTTDIHDHMFPSANTAIPQLVGLDPAVLEKHRAFNEGVMRVDLFALRQGEDLEGEITAPIGPDVPALEPGETYVLDAVIRTLKMGHLFTQGTADSNQVWLDVRVVSDGRVVGRSGGMDPENRVDPWSHFVNAYVLDREGNRISRRNAQDIFVPLYNHQIPPGAADTIHLRLPVPEDVTGTLTVEARLQYRKFDSTYMDFVLGEDYVNELPILTLASDTVTFPVGGQASTEVQGDQHPLWQRWNDWGIGLLLKGGKSQGELRDAERAFREVEALGRPDGPLNLARVFIAQGTVQDRAIEALSRAARFDPPAPSWTVAWLRGTVNQQNGFLDEAIADFRSIVDVDTEETRRRGFDFSVDYRVRNALGQALFEKAKATRGEARAEERDALLREAVAEFESALAVDPENVTAHFNLSQVYRQLGEADLAAVHRGLHARYKPDDNARDRAISIARSRDPAADHAAEAITIYDLRREGAYELEDGRADERRAAPFELIAIPDERAPATTADRATERGS